MTIDHYADHGYSNNFLVESFREMSRKIIAIGIELASEEVETLPFNSKASLLDWDIVLFRPDISSYYSYGRDNYQGKPCLGDSSSFQLKESSEHWRREIKEAVEAGKTVLIYLSPLQEVYIDTGQRQYSGTGRNQKTTRMVALYNNYASMPLDLSPVSASGKAMKMAPLGAEVMAPYWKDFGSTSEYNVLITAEKAKVWLTTKSGAKPVGALLRSKSSSGTLVMLPDIDFCPENFTRQEEDEEFWTADAEEFSARFIHSVIALDKALHSASEVTPKPNWASDDKFLLAAEASLLSALLDAEKKVEAAQRNKEEIQEELNSTGHARALLYEKGKPLEDAIIKTLKMLGFSAQGYKDGGSEFDVVFECAEGRLLGEAEGKDSKAVNVDKLRQLSMNVYEDLQREEVSTPAKGVLFGNGFRLDNPDARATQFTEKCIAAAIAASTALVSTSSLFEVVQHLESHIGDEFARECREAIISGVGLIAFPIPSNQQKA